MANLSVVDLKEHLGQFVELSRSNLLRFAEQLIALPSPNPPGDERLVVATIQRELEALGLKDVALVSKSDRRPNLLCRVSGKNSSPVLILNGHTDTKPAGGERRWKTDPFHPTVRRGRLYGLGACDMKGAIASLVYAAAAIDSLPQRLPANLVLALTADEEADTRYGARYVVEEYGLRGDCGLVCEGSGISRDFEQLCLLSSGFSAFKVKSYGTQIHSSVSDLVPSLNASTMLARVLCRFDREPDVRFPAHSLCPQGATVNLGVRIQGGVGYGTYPGYAEFGVDVRTLPGMSQDGLRADVERVLEQFRRENPSSHVELEFEPPPLGWLEGSEMPSDHPLVECVLLAAEEVLGFRPDLSAYPAGTDAGILQRRGNIPTIPAFGRGLLPLAHSPNEYIRVESIIQAAKIYAYTAPYYLTKEAERLRAADSAQLA